MISFGVFDAACRIPDAGAAADLPTQTATPVPIASPAPRRSSAFGLLVTLALLVVLVYLASRKW